PVGVRDHELADLPDHDPFWGPGARQRHGHHLPGSDARRRLLRSGHHLAARKGQLMRVAERTRPDGGKAAPVSTESSVSITTAVGGRKRRGVNREGLEAGRRSTRAILWILL